MRWHVLLGLAAASIWLGSQLGGCGWDGFDPRLSPGGGSGGAAGGQGGAGGSAGGEGGDAGSGGKPSTEGCGRIDLLQDTFNDGVMSHVWYVSGTGSVNESNGINLAADPGTTHALYRSSRRYDFSGGTVSVRLLAAPDAATGEAAAFLLERDDANWAGFVVGDGNLYAGVQRNGGFTPYNELTPYDAAQHAYLRFRERNGELAWEVSADGTTFDELLALPLSVLFPMQRVRVGLGAIRGASGPVSVSELDNIAGQSQGADFSWCAASTLEDDFADGLRSDEWINSAGDPLSTAFELDGELHITLSPGDPATREYISSQAFDLTDSEVLVEVPETSAAPSQTYLALRGPEGTLSIRVVSAIDGTTMEETHLLEAVLDLVTDDEDVLASTDYDPSTHRWWRIGERGGGLVFEHSPDGQAWEQLASRSPSPLAVDDLLVVLGATTPAGGDPPGQSRFDNLNLAP